MDISCVDANPSTKLKFYYKLDTPTRHIIIQTQVVPQ